MAFQDLLATPQSAPSLRYCTRQRASSEAVRKLGLEGIVGKRTDSICEAGERSTAWIKLRVGGYIPGSRGFDALLVGFYENKEFNFVAKVKNGFAPRRTLST